MEAIYLDHNATTPLDPRVLQAMLPFFQDEFGNAASRHHAFGRRARAAVEQARQQVARLIGAAPEEIVWTSGATESNNLAILGTAAAYPERRHLVTSAVEHKAVLDPCRHLARQGHTLTVLPVDAGGLIDPAALAAALRPDTLLVSVMAANNEIGTLQPLAEIGRICSDHGALYHCDAAQAVGRVALEVQALGIDLLSLSGHKLHGPKGSGALYLRGKRPRVRCRPLLHGGGHENGLRSGTLDVPAIVGLGAACAIAREELEGEAARQAGLRERLWARLQEGLSAIARNGHPVRCLPNTLNVRFDGLSAEQILWALGDELAVSSGSACTTASLEPSHVLCALGLSDDEAFSSLRFSLGRFTTEQQIDRAAERVIEVVHRLRAALPGGADAGARAVLAGLFA
ncbi:MAG: cysteine desulfurase [Deltaproteobacteria bacterium]|nr:cysteine desulfurase [Deltaproteobacteria bacterium]